MNLKNVKRLSLLLVLFNISMYCTAQSIDKNNIYGIWESNGPYHSSTSNFKKSGELVLTSKIKGMNDIVAYFDFKVVQNILVMTSRVYGTKTYHTILVLTDKVMVTEGYINGEKIVSTYTKKVTN